MPGASFNIGLRGAFTTLGIPGTGLSYRAALFGGRSRGKSAASPATSSLSPGTTLGCLGAFILLLGLIILLSGASTWGLILVGLASLLFLLQARATKRSAALRAAEERIRQAEAERRATLTAILCLLQALATRRSAELRRASLTARFDDETSSRILAGQIWIGQTGEQLREALGEPLDIDEKVMKTKRREVWKYDQKSANRFNTRVTLENGLVPGWERR